MEHSFSGDKSYDLVTLTMTKLLLWHIVNCGALMKFLIVTSSLLVIWRNISPNAWKV